jgi:hypothetical protein
MDDLSIFLIGSFVTLLFLAGIILSILEFRKMDLRPEEYGAEEDFEPWKTPVAEVIPEPEQ